MEHVSLSRSLTSKSKFITYISNNRKQFCHRNKTSRMKKKKMKKENKQIAKLNAKTRKVSKATEQYGNATTTMHKI